ncbi:MAG: DUF992 domain-containing protein [Rhizobiaceae bacterium]
MNLKSSVLPALVLASTALAAMPAQAQNSKNTQVGMLTCTVDTSIGLLIGSRKNFACNFRRSDGTTEGYVGTATKIGLDVGITGRTVVKWAVFAPSVMSDKGALEGRYAGVSAQATVGLGVGANALVGGKNTVVLQPFSVSGQTGLNVAAGFGGMNLVPAAN